MVWFDSWLSFCTIVIHVEHLYPVGNYSVSFERLKIKAPFQKAGVAQ